MISALRRGLSSAEGATLARHFSATSSVSHGGLQDKDRIFTNIYGKHDIFINGAMKRGDWYRCDPQLVRVSRPAVHRGTRCGSSEANNADTGFVTFELRQFSP